MDDLTLLAMFFDGVFGESGRERVFTFSVLEQIPVAKKAEAACSARDAACESIREKTDI